MNLTETLQNLGLSSEQITAISDAVGADDGNQSDNAAITAELERLRKHNDKLLAEKKEEADKRKAEQAEKDRLAEESARKKGDFEWLES